jgi:hypothetical protein
MDMRLTVRNWLWPVIWAIANGTFLFIADRWPALVDLLEQSGVDAVWLAAGLAAGLGFLMTKWNPTQGKDQTWFVPKAQSIGDSPDLKVEE